MRGHEAHAPSRLSPRLFFVASSPRRRSAPPSPRRRSSPGTRRSRSPPGTRRTPSSPRLDGLYCMMAVADGSPGGAAPSKLPVLLFAVQLALKRFWSYCFFGSGSGGGPADILVLWCAHLATTIVPPFFSRVAAPRDSFPPVSGLGDFAAALNFEIWRLKKKLVGENHATTTAFSLLSVALAADPAAAAKGPRRFRARPLCARRRWLPHRYRIPRSSSRPRGALLAFSRPQEEQSGQLADIDLLLKRSDDGRRGPGARSRPSGTRAEHLRQPLPSSMGAPERSGLS